jgi:hypothetical protein
MSHIIESRANSKTTVISSHQGLVCAKEIQYRFLAKKYQVSVAGYSIGWLVRVEGDLLVL